MDRHSQNTLDWIEQNDARLAGFRLGGERSEFSFHSNVSDDYSRLGAAIGNNTHLTCLVVNLDDNSLSVEARVEDRGFYDGLKRNLFGHIMNNIYNHIIIGGVLHEILKVYQENSSHLTRIGITSCNLVNGGDGAIATTLRSCTNLKRIHFYDCAITDEQLLQLVEGIRGHRLLEDLDLWSNRIGAAGCEALATLLKDSNCTRESSFVCK